MWAQKLGMFVPTAEASNNSKCKFIGSLHVTLQMSG
uniref:Uncharacterized protein n=1 Tax=Arundo donax TaxID=35708 RepID=A0A0A8ZQS2_ARUDO